MDELPEDFLIDVVGPEQAHYEHVDAVRGGRAWRDVQGRTADG